MLRYLGAYTHRVAISNHRPVALADGNVTLRWRDSAHGNKKRLMTLPVEEFLRRFFLHLLPRGFVRIRSFGFLANRQLLLRSPPLHEYAARTRNRSLESSSCSGTYRVSASQLTQNALPAFSPAPASPLNHYDLALQPPRTALNSNPAHQPDLLNHIQNP